MRMDNKVGWSQMKEVKPKDLWMEFKNFIDTWNAHDSGSRQWSNVNGAGITALGAASAAAPSAQQMESTVNVWVDEAGNNLKFQVKYSNGTVKNGTLALV